MQSTPTGLAIGAGAVALVVAAIIAAPIPSADAGWRFAIMTIAVGLFAAISLDQRALAGVVVLAALIYNGFLEDRLGQLAWHGSGDLWRLLLLVTVSAGGLALGESVRLVANLRARSAADFNASDFDRATDETYGMEPAVDEMSRMRQPESSDADLPGWATDLASAAKLAGWNGPRPIDMRPIDTRPIETRTCDKRTIDIRPTDVGRADTDPRASDRASANRPMSSQQASP
jgi:hypothetical protein